MKGVIFAAVLFCSAVALTQEKPCPPKRVVVTVSDCNKLCEKTGVQKYSEAECLCNPAPVTVIGPAPESHPIVEGAAAGATIVGLWWLLFL